MTPPSPLKILTNFSSPLDLEVEDSQRKALIGDAAISMTVLARHAGQPLVMEADHRTIERYEAVLGKRKRST